MHNAGDNVKWFDLLMFSIPLKTSKLPPLCPTDQLNSPGPLCFIALYPFVCVYNGKSAMYTLYIVIRVKYITYSHVHVF